MVRLVRYIFGTQAALAGMAGMAVTHNAMRGLRERSVDLIPTRSASEAETAEFLAGAAG